MAWSKQVAVINYEVTDEEQIKEIVQPIVEFVDKHGIIFELRIDPNKYDLIATYEAYGKTSAYCKGMVAEIKQMLKDTFRCKPNVVYYAY